MSKQVRRAAVIGGGIMGADIATVFSLGGWQVDIVEPSEMTRATLPEKLTNSIERHRTKAKVSRAEIYSGLTEVDWNNVDIVVECATEDLGIKQNIFAQLEKIAPTNIPLTSNSSSYPISAIGSALK